MAGTSRTPHQWIGIVVVAGLLATVGDIVGSLLLYAMYHRFGGAPATTLQSLVTIRYFLYDLAVAVVFAVAYRRWPSIERRTETTRGLLGVAACYGAAVFVALRLIIFRTGFTPLPYALIGLLIYVVFISPPIVWVTSRLAGGKRDAASTGRPESKAVEHVSRDAATPKNMFEIAIGVLAIIVSVALINLATSKAGGALIFFAIVIIPTCGIVSGIGARMFLRGLWSFRGWSGRGWETLTVPIGVGAIVIFYGLFRPPVSF